LIQGGQNSKTYNRWQNIFICHTLPQLNSIQTTNIIDKRKQQTRNIRKNINSKFLLYSRGIVSE